MLNNTLHQRFIEKNETETEMNNIFEKFAYICEDEPRNQSERKKSVDVVEESTGLGKRKFVEKEVIEIFDSDDDTAIPRKIPEKETKGMEKEISPVSVNTHSSQALVVGGLKELYKSPTQEKESVLKLLIVGHNPSQHSYTKGHYYANPVNRFWSLMRKGGLVPNHYTPNHDQDCPKNHCIGFTDVAWNFCETKSANLSDSFLYEHCKKDFYQRLTSHLRRIHEDNPHIPLEQCYPRIIAFTGVRQWKALFPSHHPIQKMNIGQNKQKRSKHEDKNFDEEDRDINEENRDIGDSSVLVESESSSKRMKKHDGQQKNNLLTFVTLAQASSHHLTSTSSHPTKSVAIDEPIKYGPQSIKPPDWPILLNESIVYLLPSPSGAAAMSNEQRESSYIALGELFRTL